MDPVVLKEIAEIRKRDADMYRVNGQNLKMREDIHTLLRHIDDILELAQARRPS